MIEIIPSINVATFEEVQRRIALAEPYVSWCHLDVTDGVFSAHETWRDPADLSRLQTKLKMEVHLMVQEPEKMIEQWLVPPIARVIVHVEAMRDPELIIKKCHDAGREIGFAIKPGTSWEVLKPWLEKIDLAMVLRVNPGASGQSMPSEMLEEISHLREACPRCTIEVDGGVTLDNARRACTAGAAILVAGSMIFNASDMGQVIHNLKNI